MINSITMKNSATFNDEGIKIKDLSEVNFIYGANGSGKTVISNFLTDYSNCADCTVDWKHAQEMDTLVYNKKFRDENLKNDSIPGVFTVGKATREEMKVIKRKEDELATIRQQFIRAKETLEKQKNEKEIKEEEYEEKLWTGVYKKYELNFKEAFLGSQYKETFKSKLISEHEKNTSDLLDFDKLKERANTIFGKKPETILPFQNISFNDVVNIENDEIWQDKIIGKSDVKIAQLIQTLNLNDWVNKGREYLQDDDVCPFCQEKTITEDFRQQLEDYFDELFTKNISNIKNYQKKYSELTANIIGQLESIEEKEKNKIETKLGIDIFSANLRTLVNQFNANKNLLENKINEPSRSIELSSTKNQLKKIEKLIQSANDQIIQHNKIVDNFQTEKGGLIKSIWKFVTHENRATIVGHKTAISGLNTGIKNIETQQQEKSNEAANLRKEIIELTKNVTSVQPTIDAINATLGIYGFLNFKIVPSKQDKNQYQIQRENGDLATNTLSEGEITFITFLYFMQLARGSKDEDNVTNNRVLIIDDPISSLDSNVLFIVSTLIKKVIKEIKTNEGNIKQLILLTHNIYFHKQVSFLNGRAEQGIKTKFRYWILRKNDKISTIQSFGKENPINTSYELLWQELNNKKHNSNITIRNTMRRIIEYYFKFLGKYGDDSLIGKFENTEEQEICRSLIQWINDGSHGISDDLFMESPDDAQNRFFNVFEMIFKKTDNQGHYDMMMEIDSNPEKRISQ